MKKSLLVLLTMLVLLTGCNNNKELVNENKKEEKIIQKEEVTSEDVVSDIKEEVTSTDEVIEEIMNAEPEKKVETKNSTKKNTTKKVETKKEETVVKEEPKKEETVTSDENTSSEEEKKDDTTEKTNNNKAKYRRPVKYGKIYLENYVNPGPQYIGTSFISRAGEPVYSVAKGEVYYLYYSSGYGYKITIRNYINGKLELFSCYDYIFNPQVEVGQKVTNDTIIGYVGKTFNNLEGFNFFFLQKYNFNGNDNEAFRQKLKPQEFIEFPKNREYFTSR